jgi:hypothetical protein
VTGISKMPSDSDFLALEALIRSVDPKRVKLPDMPIGTYLQEAEDLYVWLGPDLARLVERGLDPAVVEGLPRRIGAVRCLQSRWNTSRLSDEEAQVRFARAVVAARDLLARLVHELQFAYRGHPGLGRSVRAIARRSGDAHLVQALSDLSVLGRNHLEPLAAIKFDPALLDEAASASDGLAGALAEARGEEAVDREAKALRDKAYTLLKESVDEIREFGRFVFWRDEDRRLGYGSAYKRDSRSKSASRSAEQGSSGNPERPQPGGPSQMAEDL